MWEASHGHYGVNWCGWSGYHYHQAEGKISKSCHGWEEDHCYEHLAMVDVVMGVDVGVVRGDCVDEVGRGGPHHSNNSQWFAFFAQHHWAVVKLEVNATVASLFGIIMK